MKGREEEGERINKKRREKEGEIIIRKERRKNERRKFGNKGTEVEG